MMSVSHGCLLQECLQLHLEALGVRLHTVLFRMAPTLFSHVFPNDSPAAPDKQGR